MNPEKLSERELLALIEDVCNHTSSEAEVNRLASVLSEDPAARRFYRNYFSLHAGLYWYQRRSADAFPLSGNILTGDVGSGEAQWSAQLDGNVNPLLPIVPDNLAKESPGAFESMILESVPRPRGTDVSPRPRSESHRGLPIANPWVEMVPWRLVGTCVFGLVLVIAMLLDLRPRANNDLAQNPSLARPAERYLVPPASAAAMLASTVDCRWKDRLVSLAEGTSIYPGQLDLVSGTAELLFGDGARVVLEGPATLMVQDAGRAVLQSGKLAAQVPKRAIGFTIGTPTAEVVDFGTEFGVAVSPEGIVDVAVLVGKVEVRSLRAPSDSRPRPEHEKRFVTAGQAVTAHYSADQLMISAASFDNIMAKALAKPFQSMARIPGKVVAYRVPDRTAGNRRDFHGGVGLDFVVESPVRIFSLGVFDHLGDGIDPSTSPTVQLWSRDVRGTPDDISDDLGSQMLASQVFTAADSSELKLGHRFKPLPQPIELSPGAYSLVAYDLADGNPFISAVAGEAVPAVLPESLSGSEDGTTKGRAGGTFARNDNESYYGDTNLNRVYTLNDTLSASGTFTISDVNTLRGKFFIGHFSQSTDDDRREFMGLEFDRGDAADWVRVRARIYHFGGSAVNGAVSGGVNVISQTTPCHFDYSYDPNYEADEKHNGPEGRLTLHFYNDADTVNSTLYAVLDGTHRDASFIFDSFGIGITTMESMEGDDSNCTAKLFIDDVTYTGHKGVVDFNTDPGWQGVGNDRDANDYGWIDPSKDNGLLPADVLGQSNLMQALIAPVGSRFGDCKPGAFPITTVNKKIAYAAGSFEYISRQRHYSEK